MHNKLHIQANSVNSQIVLLKLTRLTRATNLLACSYRKNMCEVEIYLSEIMGSF